MGLVDLTPYLQTGLASDERLPISVPHLSLCEGFKPTEFGMSKVRRPTAFPSNSVLSTAGITKDYPFPQLFRGPWHTLLCDKEFIYTVHDVSGAVTKLDVYDFDNPTVLLPITGPSPGWTFTDFMSGWFITDQTQVIFYLPGYADKVFRLGSVQITTFANFRNRFMYGGVKANYSSSAWLTFFHALFPIGHSTYGFTQGQPHDTAVGWGGLVGGDILMPFNSTLAQTGNLAVTDDDYSSSDPLYLDYLRRNQSGNVIMEGRGQTTSTFFAGVRRLFPTRKGVLVFLLDSVSFLYPAVGGGEYSIFGREENILNVGIKNATSVGGNYDKQLLVDSQGVLWLLQDLKPTRLGYANVFSPYLGEVFFINYDPFFDEFYITFESAAFLLSPKGLSRVRDRVTGMHNTHDWGLRALVHEDESVDQSIFQTAPIDFGIRESKTVSELEATWQGSSPVFARLYYRDGSQLAWSETEEKQFDPRGRLRLGATGVEFKVELSCALGTNTITSLKLMVEGTTKTAIGT